MPITVANLTDELADAAFAIHALAALSAFAAFGSFSSAFAELTPLEADG